MAVSLTWSITLYIIAFQTINLNDLPFLSVSLLFIDDLSSFSPKVYPKLSCLQSFLAKSHINIFMDEVFSFL